jgi:hypothetical protein
VSECACLCVFDVKNKSSTQERSEASMRAKCVQPFAVVCSHSCTMGTQNLEESTVLWFKTSSFSKLGD